VRGDIDRAVEIATEQMWRDAYEPKVRYAEPPAPIYCAGCHDVVVPDRIAICAECRKIVNEPGELEPDELGRVLGLIALDDAMNPALSIPPR
jgi:hypothetical protein